MDRDAPFTPTRRLDQLSDDIAARAEFPEASLVIALSGGADSAAAAWLAIRADRDCRAVHVNHRLPHSARMAEAARTVSRQLDLEFDEVPVAQRTGPSEESLRRARYGELAKNCRPEEAVITAHTADDQAETVLANLLRGAGLDGIAGIPPQRGRFYRPLLKVWRAETREVATLAGLGWEDDPENDDPRYLRNRIRRRLIPRLEEEYQPKLRQGLARLSALARADLDYLEKVASEPRIRVSPDGEVQISRAELAGLPPPILSRVARRALRLVRGPYGGTRAEVDRVTDVALGKVSRTELGGGVVVTRAGDRLLFRRRG